MEMLEPIYVNHIAKVTNVDCILYITHCMTYCVYASPVPMYAWDSHNAQSHLHYKMCSLSSVITFSLADNCCSPVKIIQMD